MSCEWTPRDEARPWIWDTGCGHVEYLEGPYSPGDSNWKFCPHCGAVLVQRGPDDRERDGEQRDDDKREQRSLLGVEK